MLVALCVDTECRDQDQIVVHVNAIDLDHQQIEAAEIRRAIHSFRRAADSATKRRNAAPPISTSIGTIPGKS
jgi:hypothetical protein